MKKYALLSGLLVMVAAAFSQVIASHFLLNQPKTPSILK